jgi:hypothetical protein
MLSPDAKIPDRSIWLPPGFHISPGLSIDDRKIREERLLRRQQAFRLLIRKYNVLDRILLVLQLARGAVVVGVAREEHVGVPFEAL